jgi:hypothetical protein
MEKTELQTRYENEYKTYRLWLIGIVCGLVIVTGSCNAFELISNQNKKNLYNSPGFRHVEVEAK